MALHAQTAQLSILTRCTDPLSPSRNRPGAPSSPATISLAPTPEREEVPSHRSDSSHSTSALSRSSSSPPHVHCGRCCVSPVVGCVGNGPLLPARPAAWFSFTPSPDVTIGICSPLSPPAGAAAAEIPGQPIVNASLPTGFSPAMASALSSSPTRTIVSMFCGSHPDPQPRCPCDAFRCHPFPHLCFL